MADDEAFIFERRIAHERLQSLLHLQAVLASLDSLVDELRWGNAANQSRDFGRGVAYAVDEFAKRLSDR